MRNLGIWDPDKDEVERFLQRLLKADPKYGSAGSAATEIERKLNATLRRPRSEDEATLYHGVWTFQ